jgi:predicted phage baseplate assembly protein
MFILDKKPVSSPADVKVSVENVEWKAVESFDASHPSSEHFVFDADDRIVLFGNGLNGRVPRAGERLVVSYQTSRGESGNVARGLRWKFKTLVVPGVSLTNPNPGIGGAPRQSTNDLELEAQALVARPNRGVTLLDLERLARATPHVRVARAKAIPNCPGPESITVVAVPKVRPGRTGPPAKPFDAFLSAVRAHLQAHRLLCDDVRVVAPIYIEVSVSARLRLTKGAGAALVVERARKALDGFFAGDLQPGDRRNPPDATDRDALATSPCPTRWPFGRSVFPSEVYAVLDSVVGVEFAADVILRASRDSAPIAVAPGGPIPIPATGLVFSGTHNLTADGGRGSTR